MRDRTSQPRSFLPNLPPPTLLSFDMYGVHPPLSFNMYVVHPLLSLASPCVTWNLGLEGRDRRGWRIGIWEFVARWGGLVWSVFLSLSLCLSSFLVFVLAFLIYSITPSHTVRPSSRPRTIYYSESRSLQPAIHNPRSTSRIVHFFVSNPIQASPYICFFVCTYTCTLL